MSGFSVGARRNVLAVLGFVAAAFVPSSIRAQQPLVVDFGLTPAKRLTLAPSTLASVGDSDDAPETMFQSMTTALRLGDGRLVVGDGSANRLVVFDRRGALVGTLGRAGAGPGERRSLTWARHQAGDSIVVYDRGLRRLSQYVDGDFTRLWSLSDFGPFETPIDAVGMLADGTLILRRAIAPATGTGSTRSRDELLAVDVSSRRSRRLVEFDGDEMYLRSSSSGGRILGTPPIRRAALVAVGQSLVVVGDSESGRIRVVRADSALSIEVEVRDGDRTLTDAGISARLDEMLRERPRAVSPQWEQLQREMIASEKFPAFGDLFVDDLDRLWIQRWDRRRSGGQLWAVVDLRTSEVIRAELPRHCRPTQVATNQLTCVRSDPEDVPAATTYRVSVR